MADLIWCVLFAPLAGVLINGLIMTGTARPFQRRYAGWIASLAVLVAFLAAVAVALDLRSILGTQNYRDVMGYSWIEVGQLSVPFAVRIDALSVTMMLVVTGVGFLIHVFSIGYMAHDERVARYFTYLNLFTFAMLLLVLANNYPLMFVGWEGVGLCSYLLIGFWFEKVSAAQAGKKAFLVNRVGDFGFLLAMLALFRVTGSLIFNTPEGSGALDQAHRLLEVKLIGIPAATFVCLMLLLGATGKSAQLPLYMWLPDAMEGPTPVSALIHAATMVTAGVYMIARSAPLYHLAPVAQGVVAMVGILTALYAAWIALRQYDIKRVLAYSTISQLGYMFAGVGVGAYWAGISHLVTHAFFKALLFLGAGAVMHSLDGQLDLRKMGNLRRYLPVTFWTFTVGWLAIAGVPGLSGFFSKDAILESALHHGYPIVFWIGVATAALTAFYMTRLYLAVFWGPERIEPGGEGHGADSHADHGHHGHGKSHAHAAHGRRHAHVHPEVPVMNVPLIALALLAVFGGAVVFALPGFLYPVTEGLALQVAGAGHAGGEHGPPHLTLQQFLSVPTAISVAAAVLGIAAALAVGAERFQKGWSHALERLFGFLHDLYEGTLHAIVVRGGTLFARMLDALVDRMVIDNCVNGTALAVAWFAAQLRELQTGYVRNYALVMLAGAVFVVGCFMLLLQNLPR